MCVVRPDERTEKDLFSLLSSSLTDSMLPSLRHFTQKKNTAKEKKIRWKACRASGQGLSSATIANLIYCLLLWQQAETDGVIWKKWRSHGKRWGESGDKGEVRKPAADRSSSDNCYITELISGCTDVVI